MRYDRAVVAERSIERERAQNLWTSFLRKVDPLARAAHLTADQPLGDLSPFPGSGITPVELGATPRWDRDAADHRFLEARSEGNLRGKPPVAAVGAELAPGLGFEGELLLARQAALRLADRLGARRGLA